MAFSHGPGRKAKGRSPTLDSRLHGDVEGRDPQALTGFGGMLTSRAIDDVQVEAGIGRDNKDRINLRSFEGFLTLLGYHILAIENRASSNIPCLRWADVLFIRAAIAHEYA